MAEQNANAVAITGGTATLTSVTTPTVQATNSAGLSLKNSGGTTQISMGAGGGDNVTVAVSTNLNGTNAQIDISPTGTGHVHIKPTGVNSVEIAPTFVGEMDNITIGSITPKAGTFTTITGQTEVLKGTGQNLLLYSQTFTNGVWANNALTVTANAGTAPDGTNTATNLIPDTSTTNHRLAQTATANPSFSYVASVYAKANGYNFARLRFDNGATSVDFTFNLTDGTYISSGGAGGTAVATSVGNSWWRLSVYGNLNVSGTTVRHFIEAQNASGTSAFAGNGTSGVLFWGAQLEVGTALNTYIPTTTTAIYGTPTLSFSGVAGLGLESNGALYVSPAGTGALQAQATTSSTVGGNARGANAVDWQTARANANQVASGQYSVVGGGNANRSSAYGNFIGGGESNFASAFDSAAVAGASNSASGGYSFTGGGLNNGSTGSYSTSVGGYFNTATGYNGFVGGGERNSTASSSAVTTQATTAVTSGSTAVTLSGSNANIKVGQLIAGTGIQTYPNQTYVAAISGTSLTLSQNASASGSPTLSFFTPNSVVVGGGNNQATGSYSFIGGGGDAGTAANRNVASGDWSFVGGGGANQATGLGAVVVGGGYGALSSIAGNTASGAGSFVGGGSANQASAQGAQVLGGASNIANGAYSTVLGYQGTSRSIQQIFTFATARISVGGDSQAGIYIERVQTTDATATVLTTNGSAASGTNQVILPNNSAYFFTGEVVSGVTGGGDTKGWTIEGVIKRGAGVGTTALVGTPTITSLYADVGAATWAIAVTADTTNGGLRVTFTGQAATTIRTVCQIRTTEMTY
jgi:hypothetical protein